MLVDFDNLFLRTVFLAPDDGATGGGEGGDGGEGGNGGNNQPPKPEEVPKYSEADFQKKMAASQKHWRKGLQNELSEKDTKIKGLEADLATLKTQFEELQVKHQPAGEEGKSAAAMELMEKKYNRQLDELKKQVVEAEQKRKEAEQKALLTRRDTMLQAALAKAGCVDMKAGMRYMLPEVYWDEEDEDWRMNTEQGNPIDLEGGVKAILPEYLQSPASQNGGSGTKQGTAGQRGRRSELELEEQKLEKLKEAVSRDPRNIPLTDQFMQQRLRVKKLRADLSSSK